MQNAMQNAMQNTMQNTMKKAIKAARSGKFVPVWPGDRHYPTSRVGFYPKYHINDRYFR